MTAGRAVLSVGAFDGAVVGIAAVGDTVGDSDCVGEAEGTGLSVGETDVGARVGCKVVGASVGGMDGAMVGHAVPLHSRGQ
jgi:hypothetical protein